MVRRRLLGAIVLVMALLVCGCAFGGSGSTGSSGGSGGGAGNSPESKTISPDEVKKGKAEAHEWVSDAVAYCKENANGKEALIEVTGMMSKGYSSDTTTSVTLIDPRDYYSEDEEDDPMKEVEIDKSKPYVEVMFTKPVEVTKWRHLMGVKGIAHYDESEPNKVVLSSAIELED